MSDSYDAIYTRQSVYKEESLSIETQIDFAKSVCTREIRYYNDPGCSGKDIKRKDYLRLMQDIEKGIIKKVAVYRLDRFSRSLLDFANAWEILNRHKVDFVSVTENFDSSTPFGEAMIFVIMIFAQLERKQIAARVKDNYYKRASLGWWPAGNGPYGFQNVKMIIDDKVVNSLTEVPEKIEHVIWMYKKYAEPMATLSTIKRHLNASGIKSPNGKTWSNTAIKRTLSGLAYVKMDLYMYDYLKKQGVEITSDFEKFTGEYGGLLVGKQGNTGENKVSVGNWEGKIDSSLWIYCQEKLEANRMKGRSGTCHKSWLPPLKCGFCSYGLCCISYNRKDGLVRKLYCSGRHMDLCDHKVYISVDDIEQEIESQLVAIMKQCENTSSVKVRPASFDEQKELLEIREKIANLISVLSSSFAEKATIFYINQELEKLEKRRVELEAELMKPVHTYVPPKLQFKELSEDEKKKVAVAYIDQILVYEDYIKIKWKI